MIAHVFFVYYISLTRTARRTEPNKHRKNTMIKGEREASILGENSPRTGAFLFMEKTEEWV